MSTKITRQQEQNEAGQADRAATNPAADMSRRGLLGRAGGVAAATIAAGALGGMPRPSWAASLAPRAKQAAALGGRTRAEHAYAVRVACAADQARHHFTAQTNGDEEAHADRIGSYTKGLPHDDRGLVDPAAYATYLSILMGGRPADFEHIPLGGTNKLAGPQGAYAYSLQGTDSAALAVPPPPAFASAWAAAEMAEMYWQALARDVPFAAYATDPLIATAAADLSRLSDYRGPKDTGAVTPMTAFRMGLAGETTGPWLSQFLWQPIPYGAMTINQRYNLAPAKSFMTTWDAWLAVQRGRYVAPKPSTTPPTRYMISGRDLATFLKVDFNFQAYLNANLILIKLGLLDPGNPYVHSATQVGVSSFGVHHLHDMVTKVANTAVRASWYHKWLVHRRVRPEEFGGRVHLHKTGATAAPIHAGLLSTSRVLDAVANRNGSYLLPLAYPDGCPLHPSYPGAHPAVTGACVTVLKAIFNESAILPNPVMANADGSALVPYSGPPLTVGGELNKLASNLATGRAFGGVHWRSDNMVGLQLGEAVALSILADERRTVNEAFKGFDLTLFDGTAISV